MVETGASCRHEAVKTSARGGDPGRSPPLRLGLIFGIIALTLLMMSVDSTIVATALHPLRVGLRTSIYWAGWTITAYSFGLVLMLPVSGKLSDRYGRRRVFLGSVLVFTFASLLCGLADNIYVLIALRAIQAAGGAGFTPSATGIVVDHFGKSRDRTIGLFGSIFPIGAMIGPIFGGLFISYWTWQGIFLVNVPFGLAVIGLGWRYIPKDPPRGATSRADMDPFGIILLGLGLLAAMLTASFLDERSGHTSPATLAVLAAIAVAAIFAFLRHVRRSPQPFIAPTLIYGPGFGVVNLLNALFGGSTFGMVALIPLYANDRYSIDVLQSATLLTAQGAAAILFSVLAALFLRRTGHRAPLYVGSMTTIVGLVAMAVRVPEGIEPYWWLAASAFVIGVGAGTINPASRNAGLQLAKEGASSLAALRTMCLQIGTMITISITTAILASSKDPGVAHAWVYAATALLQLVSLPLISRVPEHRGAW